MLIRRADARDRPAVIRLWAEVDRYHRAIEPVWPQRWNPAEPLETVLARLLAPVWDDPQQIILLAEEGGQPAGFVRAALVDEEPTPARIETLGVTSSYRRQGIGRALLEEALAWCVDREADEVALEANHGAVQFYERLGFKPVFVTYFKPAPDDGESDTQDPVGKLAPESGAIRRAEAADEGAVVDLWDDVRRFHRELEPHWPRRWLYPPPDIRSRLAQNLAAYWRDPDRQTIFVVDTGRRLTGFIRVALMDSWLCPAQVQSLYVDDAYRSQGLGRFLMDRALAWCAEQGADEVGLHVSPSNVSAARFYERLGFHPFLLTYFRALPAKQSGQ
ncbi:MAG: hypothetical protein CL878_01145 [Dehalococcoidia bacterium]|nr:hypothetical protein [Dehalococcoidia bacterium]